MRRLTITLFIICIVWFAGVKPFMGEVCYMNGLIYPQLREDSIRIALQFDPHNSQYQMRLATHLLTINQFSEGNDYMEKAIIENNGDITPWAIWYMKGVGKLKTNDLFAAKDAFERAMIYNPHFKGAVEAFRKVDDIIDGRVQPKE